MEARMDPHLVGQQLDDIVCADVGWTGKVDPLSMEKFTEVYKDLCLDVGIRLASTDDPDKAFDLSARRLVWC